MSISFDWEFQEEHNRPDHTRGGAARSGPRRRWPRRVGILVLILLLIGVPAGLWIRNRLKVVEDAQETLRNAVELEFKTIADSDIELFRDRQDPEDVRWQAFQIARHINQQDSFVPAPGLTPAERPPEIDQIHVLGRTGSAELTRWFRPLMTPSDEQADGSSVPLPFRIVWFYVQADDGVWYHVSAPAGYRDVPYSWHGSRLVIRATEAEAELLDPIARDLALLVMNGCRLLGCPDQAHYTLSFSGQVTPRIQGDRWILPALHLTGMPDGDEARSEWLSALKSWMVEQLTQAHVGQDGIAGRIIYHQLLAALKAELGLTQESTAQPRPSDTELVAQALRDGHGHTLQRLWVAEYSVTSPRETQLLEAEAALLLQWIEDQVGEGRVFELFSALGEYSHLNAALASVYRLASSGIEQEWLAHLYKQTGVASTLTTGPQAQLVKKAAPGRLRPPPAPSPPSITPGDQIAFICSGRVWVGNADGTNLVPLTARGEAFADLYWSPDGRWLLTSWQLYHSSPAARDSPARALYLLAADGSGGRLLTTDPAVPVRALGWTPGGREVIHYAWPDGTDREPETRVLNAETGETRELAAVPLWSRDGKHIVYITEPPGAQGSTVWLAKGNWEYPRTIAEDVGVWPGGAWSPDNTRVALALYDIDQDQDATWIYDVETGHLSSLATASDLAMTVSASNGFQANNSADIPTLAGDTLQNLRVAGWSSDGHQLAIWAQWRTVGTPDLAPAALIALPVDGSPPRLLAYDELGSIGTTNWSPTDGNQLTFSWLKRRQQLESTLTDLQAGPLYTAPGDGFANWSSDGAWIAFGGADRVKIVDRTGQTRYVLGDGPSCWSEAWNPAANLGGLGQAVKIVSSTAGWEIANTRVHQDPETAELQVWGELVNYTGGERRIEELTSTLRDGNGNLLTDGQAATFPPSFIEMIQAVDGLAEGSAVPFGFDIPIPHSVSVKEDLSIAINVGDSPGEATRDDLDILWDGYDLATWPIHMVVRGVFENPGPHMDEQVTVLTTAYDKGGRVLGWGWTHRQDAGYLRKGGHYFELNVPAADFSAELGLRVGSYKIYLAGR